jgi:hypothetical protein
MPPVESQPAAPVPQPIRLRIDEVMPRFDVNVVQHIVVNAGLRETYQAVLDTDLMDNAVTQLMIAARDLPNRLRRSRPSAAEPERTPQVAGHRPAFRMGAAAGEGSGWVTLRDAPGVEFLVGLVGQFWYRDYGIVRLSPEQFAGFDQPGYAKTLAGFALHPHGEGRTLLTYESRTLTTDVAARRRFAAYWLVLRPFVRRMLSGALVSMKRHAEHGSTSWPTSSFAPLPTSVPDTR